VLEKHSEMAEYLPAALLLGLVIVFVAGSFLASRILAPRRPTPAKADPYECGIVPVRGVPQRYPVAFYLVAMVFVMLDIEVIFVFPWALVLGELGIFGLVEMGLFAVVVLGCFLYLLANGALNWGPPRKIVRQLALRTTESAVVRVPSSEHREPSLAGR
jgi:NADH-quinone oxidoreductase subunit A